MMLRHFRFMPSLLLFRGLLVFLLVLISTRHVIGIVVCLGFLYLEDTVPKLLVLSLAVFRLFCLVSLLGFEFCLNLFNDFCLNSFGLLVQHADGPLEHV